MEVVPVSDAFTIKDIPKNPIQNSDSAQQNPKPAGNNYAESLDSGFGGEDATNSSPESVTNNSNPTMEELQEAIQKNISEEDRNYLLDLITNEIQSKQKEMNEMEAKQKEMDGNKIEVAKSNVRYQPYAVSNSNGFQRRQQRNNFNNQLPPQPQQMPNQAPQVMNQNPIQRPQVFDKYMYYRQIQKAEYMVQSSTSHAMMMYWQNAVETLKFRYQWHIRRQIAMGNGGYQPENPSIYHGQQMGVHGPMWSQNNGQNPQQMAIGTQNNVQFDHQSQQMTIQGPMWGQNNIQNPQHQENIQFAQQPQQIHGPTGSQNNIQNTQFPHYSQQMPVNGPKGYHHIDAARPQFQEHMQYAHQPQQIHGATQFPHHSQQMPINGPKGYHHIDAARTQFQEPIQYTHQPHQIQFHAPIENQSHIQKPQSQESNKSNPAKKPRGRPRKDGKPINESKKAKEQSKPHSTNAPFEQEPPQMPIFAPVGNQNNVQKPEFKEPMLQYAQKPQQMPIQASFTNQNIIQKPEFQEPMLQYAQQPQQMPIHAPPGNQNNVQKPEFQEPIHEYAQQQPIDAPSGNQNNIPNPSNESKKCNPEMNSSFVLYEGPAEEIPHHLVAEISNSLNQGAAPEPQKSEKKPKGRPKGKKDEKPRKPRKKKYDNQNNLPEIKKEKEIYDPKLVATIPTPRKKKNDKQNNLSEIKKEKETYDPKLAATIPIPRKQLQAKKHEVKKQIKIEPDSGDFNPKMPEIQPPIFPSDFPNAQWSLEGLMD